MKTEIILALDFDRLEDAQRMVRETQDWVSRYKIGSIMFTAFGPRSVELVRAEGKEVFLDLKFHDIPNTVRGAVRAACRWGVSMLTVHCSGGIEMMRAAISGAEEGLQAHGSIRPKIIGVTVLTSLSASGDALGRVLELTDDAAQAGIDGVVCSPAEVSHVKQSHGQRLLAVVPGIRLPQDSTDDQVRVGTPRQAAGDGADFLVVGRSVTGADNPGETLHQILKEVGNA